MATVVLTTTAQAEFDDLPVTIRARVLTVFDRLRAWPATSGAKPMRGALAGHYRIRTGDWRVLFHPVGATVVIDRIANRRDVYDE